MQNMCEHGRPKAICGECFPTETPSSPSPKPEMLEKARALRTSKCPHEPLYWYGCNVCVAALLEALRASEASVAEKAARIKFLEERWEASDTYKAITEALDRQTVAEASVESLNKIIDWYEMKHRQRRAQVYAEMEKVESLRKERDRAKDRLDQFDVLLSAKWLDPACAYGGCQSLTLTHQIEAARAEATKAERERLTKFMCDWCVRALAIRAPHPPEPNPNCHCSHLNCRGKCDCPVCVPNPPGCAPSSPPPPSEEPSRRSKWAQSAERTSVKVACSRPDDTLNIHGADECCEVCEAVPSPEPTREEPR